ncbi:Uncharacterised protein g2880 [Pycnogonum litorale]
MRVTFEATNKATEYLCENKAERALDFFKNKGVQCMMQAGNDIMTCINGTATSLNDFENVLPVRYTDVLPGLGTDQEMHNRSDGIEPGYLLRESRRNGQRDASTFYNENLGCNGSLKNDGTKGRRTEKDGRRKR